MIEMGNVMWLVGLVVLLINVVIGRVRMRGLIADGKLTEREANRFCLCAAVVAAVWCALFGVCTRMSGVPAECLTFLPLGHRGLWPTYALSVSSGALLIYWLWKRGGDELLARVGPAFTRGGARGKTYTPRQVRLWLTALPIIAGAGFIGFGLALPRIDPANVPSGCAAQLSAGSAGGPASSP